MPSGVDELPVKAEPAPANAEAPNGPGEDSGRGSPSGDVKERKSPRREDSSSGPPASRPSGNRNTGEEGVEVVLNERGSTRVVDSSSRPRPTPDQNVFRHPQAVRPRAMRAPPSGPPRPPPYVHGSGSWGYGPPPPHGDYPPPPPPRPYPVPPYNPSGSFDEQSSYHHHTPHYSPHIQYPPPRGGYPPEDVNVISPNHKGDPHYRPPLTPRPRHLPPPQHYYQYPPTSPVSRPGAQPAGPPRLRSYAMRRGDGPYSKAQRTNEQYHPEDGTWNPYPSPAKSGSGEISRNQPPLVTESSFDSEHHSGTSHSHPSHPPTPGGGPPHAPLPPPPPPSSHDPHYQFYGGGGSWGSFDSGPPHFDDQRYYGFSPDSPYSPYGPYSPGGLHPGDSFPPPPGYGPPPPNYSYSYDEEERLLKDYHPDRDADDGHKPSTPNSRNKGRSKTGTPVASNTTSNNMLVPKAAEEVDFEVTDPPNEPVVPPSQDPVCDSLAEVNSYDVLCGRGGGTNSQIGNRRFRKLVQEFQPIYLLARRKEKPLLARTIVIIIRKRGGRFLKKDEDTGELFEVGDAKAEAKTSQALREGLDVRATKSAASSLLEKKKKKQQQQKSPKEDDEDVQSPQGSKASQKEGESTGSDTPRPAESPPTLPKLQDEEAKSGNVHPHSPDQMQFRKRRRMRPAAYGNDRFFPDFCPPRADLARTGSPAPEDGTNMDMGVTPARRNASRDDDNIRYDNEQMPAPGCAGIAFDMVTGAATGSFCLGPNGWRR